MYAWKSAKHGATWVGLQMAERVTCYGNDVFLMFAALPEAYDIESMDEEHDTWAAHWMSPHLLCTRAAERGTESRVSQYMQRARIAEADASSARRAQVVMCPRSGGKH